MSPEERYQRDVAASTRAACRRYLRYAAEHDQAADLIALQSLSVAEVESLRRLCRGDCANVLAEEGRG